MKIKNASTTELFPVAGPLPQSDIFSNILTMWDERRGDAGVPHRNTFSFQDLKGWHSFMALSKYNDDGSDSIASIVGEGFMEIFAGNVTLGMKLSEMPHPNVRRLLEYHQQVKLMPAIGLFKGYLPNLGRDHLSVEMLELPLLGDSQKVEFRYTFITSNKKPQAMFL